MVMDQDAKTLIQQLTAALKPFTQAAQQVAPPVPVTDDALISVGAVTAPAGYVRAATAAMQAGAAGLAAATAPSA